MYKVKGKNEREEGHEVTSQRLKRAKNSGSHDDAHDDDDAHHVRV